MKQKMYALEVITKEDDNTFILRDPRNGQVLVIGKDSNDIADFLDKDIVQLKNAK